MPERLAQPAPTSRCPGPTFGLGPDGTLYAAEGCCGNPVERILAFGSVGSARAAWSVCKVPVSDGIIVGLDIAATGEVWASRRR